MDAGTERQLQEFVAHEARLLDAGRWDDWLQLFAPDVATTTSSRSAFERVLSSRSMTASW